jgi:two-component system sensor histidine kinase PhoQ
LKLGIQTRLLLLTTVVLGTFLTLAGIVLDRSFKASVVAGAQDQLRIVVYSLMGTVEDDGRQLLFRGELPEPRLSQPESGLYAAVTATNGMQDWRSPSAITTGVGFPTDATLEPGDFLFAEFNEGVARFFLSYAVIWEVADDSVLTFTVGLDQRPFQAAIQGFRRNLYIGLGAVTALFVLAQYVAVRLGLRPLRTMASEVRDLEEGRRESLSSNYPRELEGLAENLGRFVAHEQRSRARYRRAMEDLAHSLKTPLAVIRNALGEGVGDGGELLADQLDRMESTVTHQLSRASVSGPVIVGRAVPVHSIVSRLLRALDKAYTERGIDVENLVAANLEVRADERDLMEMLGNVLENAFKYTRSRIAVSSCESADPDVSKIEIIVEDDGPGIEPGLRREVLNRGTRADLAQPGQGIGLAMVMDLVAAYAGKLEISESRWGGAKVVLILD